MSTVLCTQMQTGDRILYCGGWPKVDNIPIFIVRDAEECLDIFGRTEMRYWARRETRARRATSTSAFAQRSNSSESRDHDDR